MAQANAAKRKYHLMAERADGTGRIIYAIGNDKEALETLAQKHTTPRTRFWVEPNPDYPEDT